MLDATNPVVQAVKNALIGADNSGYVVSTRNYGSDSSDVVRVNRTTAEIELLARMKQFPGVRGGVPAPIYGRREYAMYSLDGWLGIQRTAPYRVDWRSPDGKWTLGKPIPVRIVKFDDRERRFYAASGPLQGGSVEDFLGRISEWPDAVEPSYGRAPIGTSDGKMLVYRTRTADFPNTRYDVVNRDGVVERQITMSVNETIVGFGAKSVYVRVGDALSAVQLERHPWP